MADDEPTEATERAYRLVGSRCFVRAAPGEWEPAGSRGPGTGASARSDGPLAGSEATGRTGEGRARAVRRPPLRW